jgi:hypothetical protein
MRRPQHTGHPDLGIRFTEHQWTAWGRPWREIDLERAAMRSLQPGTSSIEEITVDDVLLTVSRLLGAART